MKELKKGVKTGLLVLAVILLIGGCSYGAANWAMDSMLNKMEHGEMIESDTAAIAPEVIEALCLVRTTVRGRREPTKTAAMP